MRLRDLDSEEGEQAWEMAAGSALFLPSNLSKVSGWLRLAVSSQSGGEWTPSIVDVLNAGSPMVQTDVDRRAAVGATSNGFPTMVYDGTDTHLWSMSPAHSSTTKVGIWIWFKPASLAAGQWLYSVLGGVAGATNNRIRFGNLGTTFYAEVYVSAGNGRAFQTASGFFTVGTWTGVYMQYDSSRGGDANFAVYKDGVLTSTTPSDSAGTVGPSGLGALMAATGSALVGSFNDNDTPTQPILNGGEIGPNSLAFNDNLTAGEIASVLNFERPL